MSAAVPTIWNDILRHAESNPVDLSSLRLVACGGSAVPRGLIEKFQDRHGVRIIQAWGMTETSPLGAIAHPPKGTAPDAEMEWRAKTGRVVAGVRNNVPALLVMGVVALVALSLIPSATLHRVWITVMRKTRKTTAESCSHPRSRSHIETATTPMPVIPISHR